MRGSTATAVGYVNAHGTGTQQNDRVEAQALRQVFGEGGSTWLSSTKSLIGHTMAGARAAWRPRPRSWPCSTSCCRRRPICEAVDPRPRSTACPARRAPPRITAALSNSFGFGGQNVSLIFGARRIVTDRRCRRDRPGTVRRLRPLGRAGRVDRRPGARPLRHRSGAGVRRGRVSPAASPPRWARPRSRRSWYRDAARRLSRIRRLDAGGLPARGSRRGRRRRPRGSAPWSAPSMATSPRAVTSRRASCVTGRPDSRR